MGDTITLTGIGTLPDALDSAANMVYVANFLSNNVTVIDGATNLVRATLADPNAKAPYALAADLVTHRVYVANSQSGNVSVIAVAR